MATNLNLFNKSNKAEDNTVFRPENTTSHTDNEVVGHEAPVAAVVRVGNVVADEIIIVMLKDIMCAGIAANEYRVALQAAEMSRFVFHQITVCPPVAGRQINCIATAGHIERSEIVHRPCSINVSEPAGMQHALSDVFVAHPCKPVLLEK